MAKWPARSESSYLPTRPRTVLSASQWRCANFIEVKAKWYRMKCDGAVENGDFDWGLTPVGQVAPSAASFGSCSSRPASPGRCVGVKQPIASDPVHSANQVFSPISYREDASGRVVALSGAAFLPFPTTFKPLPSDFYNHSNLFEPGCATVPDSQRSKIFIAKTSHCA
jgi:hypothetical protein